MFSISPAWPQSRASDVIEVAIQFIGIQIKTAENKVVVGWCDGSTPLQTHYA